MNMHLGPIMLDLEGVDLTPEESEMLQHPHVGGVILFTRNYESPKQMLSLTKRIRKIRSPLLIAVDQEGGRVQRFRQGFTELPPLSELGVQYEKNSDHAKQLAEQAAFTMASEVRAVGVDFSFAPVLDINWGKSEVIGNRSFHRDSAVIVELANAYIHGMHRAGMPATGKHFPGHGAVLADSHLELPVDERDYQTLISNDLVPFMRLADKLDGIMSAHVIYSAIDKQPASFSQHWLRNVLRNIIKFSGCIFSDDITMQAANVIGDYEARAKVALDAGSDMVLVCNNRQGAIQVLDCLKDYHNQQSGMRLKKFIGL